MEGLYALRTLISEEVMDSRKVIIMEQRKRIALVAHNHKKHEMLEWAKFNKVFLAQHELYATGTTGRLLEEELGFTVHKLLSGPLGGDQQIGAKISEHEIDLLIFFWDPLEQQPHDPDVKALLRIAVVWNIPVACNRASADFLISSPLMRNAYQPHIPGYEDYLEQNYEDQVVQEHKAAEDMEGSEPVFIA
jgi:methylglyoxal synthase